MAIEENRFYPYTAGKMLFRRKTQRKPPRHNQTLRLEFDSYFSNSLIIHKENSKEINV